MNIVRKNKIKRLYNFGEQEKVFKNLTKYQLGLLAEYIKKEINNLYVKY